jgi:hypothetical protein
MLSDVIGISVAGFLKTEINGAIELGFLMEHGSGASGHRQREGVQNEHHRHEGADAPP